MIKSVIIHLIKSAKKLVCGLNASNPELDKTVEYIIKTQTAKGNALCPCVADGSVFCPCKPWVQRIKTGKAKPGDTCHCEVFVKV